MKVVCGYIDKDGNESPTLELEELLDPNHPWGLTMEQRRDLARRYFKPILEGMFPGAKVTFIDNKKAAS